MVCSQARFGLSVGGPVGAGTPVAITDVGRPLHFDSAIRTKSYLDKNKVGKMSHQRNDRNGICYPRCIDVSM